MSRNDSLAKTTASALINIQSLGITTHNTIVDYSEYAVDTEEGLFSYQQDVFPFTLDSEPSISSYWYANEAIKSLKTTEALCVDTMQTLFLEMNKRN